MDYKRKQTSDLTDARDARDAHAATKPGEYTYAGKQDLDDARDKLLNREKFQYSAELDPLYKSYRDMYVSNGRQAMEDTVAQSTALTGGYGNSWAQSAGQQVYNGYMNQLTDKIPQLYQMALNKYLQEGDALRGQFDILSRDEDQAYSRYMASAENWQRDQDRLNDEYWREREWAENLRRYEEGKSLRGGGGGGGGSYSSGGGSPAYGEMDTPDLKAAMSSVKSRQEAKHLAEDMILEGVPEDMAMRLFEMYWNRGGAAAHDKPTRPRPGPNRDMVNLE